VYLCLSTLVISVISVYFVLSLLPALFSLFISLARVILPCRLLLYIVTFENVIYMYFPKINEFVKFVVAYSTSPKPSGRHI
jgi:hypothetical protein